MMANFQNQKTPIFSICIPTYEMHGKGAEFLERLFGSLKKQTCQEFEVVVSDHSRDDGVQNVCARWAKRFTIRYFPYPEKRGNSSANMNNALRHARGEIIKIIHQDDFLYSDKCLQKISERLASSPASVWGASGFVHTSDGKSFYRKIIPYYQKDIIRAVNTIGAPSVLFFRNNKSISFDENLIWMNDCELCFRLYNLFGPPVIIDELLVAIGVWPEQVTNTLAVGALRNREIAYSLKKHGVGKMNHSFEKIARPVKKAFIKVKSYRRTIQDRYHWITGYFLAKKNKENPLTALANKYRSDKGTRKTYKWEGDRHFYTEYYHKYFEKMRFQKLNILEIGVGGGQSLKIWPKYFPHSNIFALDIGDFSNLNTKSVTCIQADQSKREDLKKAMEKIGGKVDIIMDDGGHYMNQQQISFGYLFKYLKPGGLYFIEDLHTSYWPHNGHVSVYNDVPIDTNEDKSNTTLHMIRGYLKNKKIESPFLTKEEMDYAASHVEKCVLHDTTVNTYGPNHLVVFIKSADEQK